MAPILRARKDRRTGERPTALALPPAGRRAVAAEGCRLTVRHETVRG
ncbi:hypothetical protein [Streptomyces sp. NPDC006446]